MNEDVIDLKKYLEGIRGRLLDLGLRNRLLNFKPSKGKVISLTTAHPDELYKELSVGNKIVFRSLSFPRKSDLIQNKLLPQELLEQIEELEPIDYRKHIDLKKWAEVCGLNTEEDIPDGMRSALQGHSLTTTFIPEDYELYFNKLYLNRQSIIQEIGTNALYLVLGFLEWFDQTWEEQKRTKKKCLAPLLVAPLRLDRSAGSHGNRYEFSIVAEDEFVLNETLRKKLLNDFAIELPEFNGNYNPSEYFKLVSEELADAGYYWRVRNRACISILDFTKLAMYEDLDPSKWSENSLLENPNIKTLILGSDREQSSIQASNIDEIQDFERSVPLVLDADNSQSTAIYKALFGRNLVIEGPPGTGKSQTITNLIAALLYQGKSVLFASEKLAALKVVKNKLDGLGLGNFCLELHSDQINKQSLRESLKKRIEMRPERLDEVNRENLYNEHEHYKEKLNDYIRAVSSNFEDSNVKKGQILLSAARYKRYFPNPERIRPDAFDLGNCSQLLSFSRLTAVKDLTSVAQELLSNAHIKKINEHPWYGVGLAGIIVPSEAPVLEALSKWNTDLLKSKEITEDLCNKFQLNQRSQLDWDDLIKTFSELPTLSDNSVSADLSLLLTVGSHDIKKCVTQFEKIYKEFNAIKRKVPYSNIDRENLRQLKLKLNCLGEYLKHATTISELVSILEDNQKFGSQLTEIETNVRHLLKKLSLNRLEDNLGNKAFLRFFANLVDQAPEMEKLVNKLNIRNTCKELANFDFEEFKTELLNLKDQRSKLNDIFNLSDVPQRDELEKCFNLLKDSSIFSWLKSDWRKARTKVKSVLKQDKSLDIGIKSLPLWIEYLDGEGKFINNPIYRELFDKLINGVDTNLDQIQRVINWCQTITDYQREVLSLEERINIQHVMSLSDTELEIFSNLGQLSFGDQIRSTLEQADDVSKFLKDKCKREISKDLFKLPKVLSEVTESFKQCEELFKCLPDASISEFVDWIDTMERYYQKYQDWNYSELSKKLPRDHWGLSLDQVQEIVDKKLQDIKELVQTSSLIKQPKLSDVESFLVHNPEDYSKLLQAIQLCEAPLKLSYGEGINFYNESKTNNKIWEGQLKIDELILRNNKALERKETLYEWLNFASEFLDAKKLRLGKVVTKIQDGEIDLDNFENAYKAMAYDFSAEKILTEEPAISKIRNIKHDQLQNKFAKLDRELQEQHIKEIRAVLTNKNVPVGCAGVRVSEYTDLRLIEHEIQKKKKLISNRELISRASGAITALKPCFMMSPLTAAQYLQPKGALFDVVVMDEASQIKPEDAIGLIARGKQIIVVGDPQQLPPTNFFQNAINNDDDDERTIIDESESILDTAWNRFDRCTLNWHYRSRHQSLIEFSNQYFYNGKLTVFPSPYTENDEFGIQLHYVQGTFDGHSTNKKEAKEIAKAVIIQLLKNPEESVGVVAMNAPQSECIRNEIEVLAANNVKIQRALDENAQTEMPWFVKNLENVQGDERDVIFISLTYGPASIGGKVPQRFGPITQEKGGRRLNVLFSRAKKRMEVFTSMHASDVLATEGRGTKILHDFLEYCNTKQIPESVIYNTNRAPDSDFEIAVAEAMRAQGFECVPQVGVRGYFIDIGVVDPRDKNKFIVGIECDGAAYHSSASARERDRLRQEILEKLGWKILRVWSTDWYQNSNAIIRYLVEEINHICQTEVSCSDQDESMNETDNYHQSVEKEIIKYFAEKSSTETEQDEEKVEKSYQELFRFDDIESSLKHIAQEIAKKYPDTDPDKRLLRPNMMNYFLVNRPINTEEFLSTCPQSLRSGTSVDEAKDYLSTVFQTLAKWN